MTVWSSQKTLALVSLISSAVIVIIIGYDKTYPIDVLHAALFRTSQGSSSQKDMLPRRIFFLLKGDDKSGSQALSPVKACVIRRAAVLNPNWDVSVLADPLPQAQSMWQAGPSYKEHR